MNEVYVFDEVDRPSEIISSFNKSEQADSQDAAFLNRFEQYVEDKRPIYVRELDLERKQAEAELAELYAGLHDLKRYLTSAKFAEPSDRQRLVNTDDVLSRLSQAQGRALDAAADVR